MTEISLVPLADSDREQFIRDNQDAFNFSALEEFGLRDEHFEKRLPSTPSAVREQIKRITYYEELMQRAELLLSEGSSPALTKLAEELASYYGSDAWKRDLAADEAGLLPDELRRGVLSEDGLYDLLAETDSLND
ncbi:MAG: DUF4298 domain-containing protein [Ruminococcus sp.]|nr:DUF4298 domain-containing protein [Ruminococcus sp.]